MEKGIIEGRAGDVEKKIGLRFVITHKRVKAGSLLTITSAPDMNG